ncbi:MAG TPA: hypothetical protein VII06_14510 [Chloroflexota bacterium]
MDEVIARYPGDWVLLQVTGHDEDGIPSEGRVVRHWPDTRANDSRISRALSDILEAEAPAENRYYLFQAYPRIRSGEAFREALAQVAEDFSEGLAGAPRHR